MTLQVSLAVGHPRAIVVTPAAPPLHPPPPSRPRTHPGVMAPRRATTTAAAASAAVTVTLLVAAALVAAQPPLAGGDPAAAAAAAVTVTPAPTAVSFSTTPQAAMPLMMPMPSATAAAAMPSPPGESVRPPPAVTETPPGAPAPAAPAAPLGPTSPPTTAAADPPPAGAPLPTIVPGAVPAATAVVAAKADPADAAGAPTIAGFWVVNATSGAWLFPLTSTTILQPAELGSYSIAAVPTAATSAGVTFSAPAKYAHTEVAPPYLLGWDVDGAARPVFLSTGTQTVAAYVGAPTGDGDGALGPVATVTFTVVFPAVTEFWVLDADPTRTTNGRRLFQLSDNSTVIDVATVGKWSIEAVYAPGDGLAVRFTEPPQYAHLERGERPLMMAPTSPGVVWPARLPLGRHTVAAHAEDWRGQRGPGKAISFVVDDSESN